MNIVLERLKKEGHEVVEFSYENTNFLIDCFFK